VNKDVHVPASSGASFSIWRYSDNRGISEVKLPHSHVDVRYDYASGPIKWVAENRQSGGAGADCR
jgi:hypothetical protein